MAKASLKTRQYPSIIQRLIEQHRQAGKQQLPPGLSETGQGCKTRQFNLTFTEGKKLVKEYELKARNKKGCEHKGFDASDALYLLMPDRFANGNPDNDQIAGMAEYKIDRKDPNARHGGDLAGIEQHLDYFSDTPASQPSGV